MTDVILNRTMQEAPNLPDSVDSYHLPDNQTFTGQLMTSESAQQSTSTNSFAVTKASLNQNPRTSDVNSRAVFAWANISSSKDNSRIAQKVERGKRAHYRVLALAFCVI